MFKKKGYKRTQSVHNYTFKKSVFGNKIKATALIRGYEDFTWDDKSDAIIFDLSEHSKDCIVRTNEFGMRDILNVFRIHYNLPYAKYIKFNSMYSYERELRKILTKEFSLYGYTYSESMTNEKILVFERVTQVDISELSMDKEYSGSEFNNETFIDYLHSVECFMASDNDTNKKVAISLLSRFENIAFNERDKYIEMFIAYMYTKYNTSIRILSMWFDIPRTTINKYIHNYIDSNYETILTYFTLNKLYSKNTHNK